MFSKTVAARSIVNTFERTSLIETVCSYPDYKDQIPRSLTEALRFAFLRAAKNYNTQHNTDLHLHSSPFPWGPPS